MTVAATGVYHPRHIGGRVLWADWGVVDDIEHKLIHGDPAKGWEGDDRLAIYYWPETEQWEIMRLEDDGVHRRVALSPPGGKFDERVIDGMLERDVRRRKKALHVEIEEANERTAAERDAKLMEWSEDLGDRLHWLYARRDMAVRSTIVT